MTKFRQRRGGFDDEAYIVACSNCERTYHHTALEGDGECPTCGEELDVFVRKEGK